MCPGNTFVLWIQWQEVSRQHVSCGEEFVFRAPFVVPFVEGKLRCCIMRILKIRKESTIHAF